MKWDYMTREAIALTSHHTSLKMSPEYQAALEEYLHRSALHDHRNIRPHNQPHHLHSRPTPSNRQPSLGSPHIMPTPLLAPIVGAYYRPPAAAILKFLPINTPLVLDPEPDNPHDPNAIKVCIEAERLEVIIASMTPERLEQFGLDLFSVGWSIEVLLLKCGETVEAEGAWGAAHLFHLGYIPRADAPSWLSALAGSPDHTAVLSFSPEGKPLCKLETKTND